ncbi:MAG: glycogen debranching protein [Bacteroidetes bacterium]|nr:glycogen debranching protein [Bacteroidota bacterium]
MTNRKFLTTCLLSGFAAGTVYAQDPIFRNSAFEVYKDKIVQGNYTAKILSAKHIVSNYQSPANEFISPVINFKFSINRKDNEMRPGVNHSFACLPVNGVCETPVIKFGTQYVDDRKVPEKTFLAPDTKLIIKVDMREVLAALKKDGFYTTFNGEKIYAQDFKELYVAGETEPMVWDFDNLHNRPQLEMKDPDGDGIYEATMLVNEQKKEKDLATDWKLSKDISAFPQYKSGFPVSDAIYNMSLEEMQRAIEPDSTFRTGKEWAGVWTRDISYSIILSMAYLQPKVAKYSLMRKVKNGKIIQDTGTGGAYPNSTDRMIWANAAWELYKATGDKDWLQQSYSIIKNSVDDDLLNAHDKVTGMVRGESSFLDWREQTYPKWMQPADIFESECLGTNAVHYQASKVLSEMATLLNKKEDAEKYAAVAQRIKDGINQHLWIAEKGYYGQYVYGSNFRSLSEKSEALGEALTVIFGIADDNRKKLVVSKTPVTAFGISCIYPQIENIPPYHNDAVWPFVQSYWAQAAAKAGNENAVLASIAAIYRPAAMFLTNKENFVATNGDYKGTVINSSNMLWSLAGNISLVHKILFGIEFKADRLEFHPFIPYAFNGKRILDNFSYRNAILNIQVEGYGNSIRQFILDGKIITEPIVPATLTGKHSIKIVMANNKLTVQVNEVANHTAPGYPECMLKGSLLVWTAQKNAAAYKVLKNGKEVIRTNKMSTTVETDAYAEYQVIAMDKEGYESFASEPAVVMGKNVINIEMETVAAKAGYDYKGFSGDGFVEISKDKNLQLSIPVSIPEDGLYAIRFRYSNGNGPKNTENKCAIRTVKENGTFIGTVIFPQRGPDEWSNWGLSNPVQQTLTKGDHVISLSFEPANENMNGEINQAMIDMVSVVKIK